MGGLFGDLPPPSDAATPSAGDAASSAAATPGWSVAHRMAPPTVLKPMFAPTSAMKRAQAQSQASASLRASSAHPSPQLHPLRQELERRSSAGSADAQASKAAAAADSARDTGAAAASSAADSLASALPAGGAALVAAAAAALDEYDPARPNEYEEIVRERKRRRREEEAQRGRERARREQEEREREREAELERQREIQLAMQREKERAEVAMAAATAAAPANPIPSLPVSGEDAWRRRAMLSGRTGAGSGTEDGAGEPDAPQRTPGPSLRRSPSPPKAEEGAHFSVGGAGSALTAAERMMMKMGWKAGQGLGKQEQGIVTPLMAKKTDKRAGVIVNAPEKGKGGKGPFGGAQSSAVGAGGAQGAARASNPGANPTKVVLLRNMVGPGEVDEELEEEVAGECQKFGDVARVLIFQVTEPGFPPAEAVRIFIAFQRQESAVKAAVDLDGRFFGGKAVRATYFSETRFEKRDLAPSPEELEQIER